MKQIKNTFLLTLLLSMVGTTAFAAVTWSYNSGTKTLTISGSGAMSSHPATVDETDWATIQTNMTTAIIGEGITSTYSNVFSGCTALTTVTIPNSVTSIGYSSFNSCSSLASITIPEGVTTIGFSAFYGCSSLTSIVFPKNIDALPSSVCMNCTNLTTVTVWHASASSYANSFNNCTNLKNIYVLADKVDTYKAATNWSSHASKISAITADQANNAADGAYWSTYYNGNYAVEADANTTVYKVSVDGTKATLTEISDKIVNAGQGVVLKSTTGPTTLTIYSSATVTTDDYTGNQLTGVDANTTISGSTYDGKSIYTLANASGFGFYKFAGATLGANKAFLAFNSDVTARDFFLFEDETTGINETVKVNTSAQYYDLQGRSIAQPTKGLYIVNGKKVIVK